jgi:large subunit ribosomal protein L3
MSAPRHGSLGVRPRKRAASIVARVRSWASVDESKPLGFPAYKVGMYHAIVIDNYPTSPTHGREVFRALTMLEAPPAILVAIRYYGSDGLGGETSIGEVWSRNLPKGAARLLVPPKQAAKGIGASIKDRASRVSLLLMTQPEKSGLSKKTPEIVEVPLGGKLSEQFVFESKLGKEIAASEVFSPPEVIDAIAVSRGKGYEGPVARFGIKVIQKKKAKKTKRGPGSDSPLTPSAVMSSVPRAGQMGFHNRVDLNVVIMEIKDKPEGMVPKAGFKHYGVPRSSLLVVEGSVPGATKRLVLLRKAVRSYTTVPKEIPEVQFVSVR